MRDRQRRINLNKRKQEEKILLSVLIPTLLTRKKQFDDITNKLTKQIQENNLEGIVEIISHCDNKTINLVSKRNNMTMSSAGKFIAHLDDDDTVADTYIIDIVNAIRENNDADVITFKQYCDIKTRTFFVVSSLEYEINLKNKRGDTYYRYPWIWCVWNREKILQLDLGEIDTLKNWGDDDFLLNKIKQSGLFQKEIKIDKVLHYYQYDPDKTECNSGE